MAADPVFIINLADTIGRLSVAADNAQTASAQSALFDAIETLQAHLDDTLPELLAGSVSEEENVIWFRGPPK